MATPDRDTVYTNDGTNRTIYTRESNSTGWFVGIIVALALLAIAYLVFSANSQPSTTNLDVNTSPTVTTPAAPADTGTTPMAPADTTGTEVTPAVPADTAPADTAPADTGTTTSAAPSVSAPAATTASSAPAVTTDMSAAPATSSAAQ